LARQLRNLFVIPRAKEKRIVPKEKVTTTLNGETRKRYQAEKTSGELEHPGERVPLQIWCKGGRNCVERKSTPKEGR